MKKPLLSEPDMQNAVSKRVKNIISTYTHEKPELDSIKLEIDALQNLMLQVKMDTSCTAKYMAMTLEAKERFVRAVFKERISDGHDWYVTEQRKRKNGELYTIYRSRPIGEKKWRSANSYEGLVEMFYSLYACPVEPLTVKTVYGMATKWKAQQPNITGKTIYDYGKTYNKYIAGTEFERMKISKVDYDALTSFYEDICVRHKATYKQVQDVRNVMAYILKYSQREHLIKHNPALEVDYSSLPYAKASGKSDKIKKTPFTPEQADKVKEWCNALLAKPRINPLHPLGIKLGLIIGTRYGELRAMKWFDIDFAGQSIRICDQATEQYVLNDDMTMDYKGRRDTGHLKGYEDSYDLPLPDEVKEILLDIKSMGLDDVYVFPANHFRYGTFNDKVKDAASAIGLCRDKYSTHTLRTTAATTLYLRTHDIYLVQRLLHHSSPNMTLKYIKDLEINEKLRASMMVDSGGH